MKHIVVFSDTKVRQLLNGELKYELRFFKKRPELLDRLRVGDVVYFKKSRGEILGQFSVGKLIIVEKLDMEDMDWIEKISNFKLQISNSEFEELCSRNSTLVIIQIEELEQLITSPIDLPKSRKEWLVLED